VPPRLALVNPWITDFAAANLWSAPLGLLTVAEFLSPYTQDFAWIDCLEACRPGPWGTGRYPKTPIPKPAVLAGVPRCFSRYGISPDRFREQLQRALPLDAILVTSLMSYWYPGVQETIRLCKQVAPQTPVILGGLYARLNPAHAARESGADAIYTEAAGAKLLDVLGSLGLDLNLRFPPRRWYELGLWPDKSYAPLLTGEGCPYKCTYCASPLLYPALTRRAPAAVLDDIRAHAARGVTDLAFYDDALLVDAPHHLDPVLDDLVRSPIPVRFHTPNGLHAAHLGHHTARLMKQSGFKTIRLSLETVDARRQQTTGGKITPRGFEQAVEALRGAGFIGSEIGVYIMYGLWEQDWADVVAGVDYLQNLGVRIQLAEYSPLPGTPMANAWAASGRVPADLDPLLANNSVFAWKYSGYAAGEISALKLKVKAHNCALGSAGAGAGP
jgi:hypothetical protein